MISNKLKTINTHEEVKFKCTKCGACCRRAGMLGVMPQREDGACIYLDENNQCKIYETRPELCRVDKMYERYKDTLDMTKTEYYQFSNGFCNEMIKEDGLSDSYLIDINSYD